MMVKESENHYKNQTGKKAKWKSSTVKSSLIMQEEKLQKETFSRFLIHPLICLFIEKSYLPILNYCCGRTTTVVLVPSIRLTNCSSLTSWQHTHTPLKLCESNGSRGDRKECGEDYLKKKFWYFQMLTKMLGSKRK